ncbi:hypothetical protein MRX96_018486 [Rhipicephalus microplus]
MPFQCSQCDKAFVVQDELKRHITLQHNKGKQKPCPRCGRVFVSDTRYEWHLRLHENNQGFQCSKCPYLYESKAYLEHHQQKHAEESLSVCEVCSKTFKTVRAMGIHVTHMHPEVAKTPSLQGACLRDSERLTVLAWQDLGRGLLLSENPHLRARFQIVHRRRDERRKVLAWRGRALSGYRLPSDDLGRGLLLSGEPAPTREVPDCPPPSRRASQGPGLARTSPVGLPATERRFVHSALNPCCCYVVATPDIYPTTITSSQGLNQPTASWSPSTAT